MIFTQEQLNTAAKLITIGYYKMPYKKVYEGLYEMYCPYCMNYIRVNYEEFCSIRNKRQCPICNTWFNSTTKTDERIVEDYIRFGDEGYRFVSKWKFGEPIKFIEYEKFCEFKGNKTLVKKNYKLKGSNYYWNIDYDNYETDEYRVSHSEKYSDLSYIYFGAWNYYRGNYKDRKTILKYKFGDCEFKSNQIKLISQNHFDLDIIPFIKVFDIKNKEDVEKYSDYLLSNHSHSNEFIRENIILNTFYLDYLSRNNIDLGRYYHYIQMLKQLGFKLDKPRDFEHRYEQAEKMIQAEKDKEANIKIQKRYEELPKYQNKDIIISPFKASDEIRKCGKVLHNCIGGYVQRYADGITDIYYLKDNDVLTVAIEIAKGSLEQAHIDHNRKCPKKYMKHIKSFCSQNGFSYSRFE